MNKSCEITVTELKSKLDKNELIILIDVREQSEIDICSIPNYIHIPLGQFTERFSEIPKDKDVVVYCKVGGRSGSAVEFLLNNGYTKVKNLVGGIIAWGNEIDPSMKKY